MNQLMKDLFWINYHDIDQYIKSKIIGWGFMEKEKIFSLKLMSGWNICIKQNISWKLYNQLEYFYLIL